MSGPRALALLLVAAAYGCGGDDDPASTPAPDGGARADDAGPGATPDRGASDPDASTAPGAYVEIGTGARRYEPLDCGEEIPIIAGPQGGFHVWGGFHGEGFDDSDVRIRFELELDGETYARADYTEFGLPPGPAGGFDYAAVAVVYDQNSDVQVTTGQVMTLRLTIEARDGQGLDDEVEVVPVCCE